MLTKQRCRFATQKQQKSLDRVKSSVDKVTHEQIVRVGTLTADLEQLHQIVELAVDVAADLIQIHKSR